MNGWRNVLTDRNWNQIFNIGIVVKVINGTLELVASFLIFFFNKNTLTNLFFNFSKEELLEDPNDKLIGLINTWLQGVSTGTQTFISIYLVIHGLLNIFLSVQLWRKKLWAYIATIIVISIFMLYQIYRISYSHSMILLLVTILDIVFLFITWRQYKYHNLKTPHNQ